MLELISSLNLQVSLKKKNDFDSIKFKFQYEMQSEDFKNFLILLMPVTISAQMVKFL